MYYLEEYGFDKIDMVEDAKAKIIEALENSYDGYLCDLHDAVFNEEYYYVGNEVLYDMFDGCEEFDELWNSELTEEDCQSLLQWLKDNGRD